MTNVKLSLRTTIIGIFVVLNIVAASVIGFLLHYNSNASSAFMVARLQQGIFNRINSDISQVLTQAEKINLSNAKLMTHGKLAMNNLDGIGLLLREQIRIYDNISNLTLAFPDGGLVAAGKKIADNSLYLASTPGPQNGPLTIYDANNENEIGPSVFKKENFDARQRPWFIAALERPGNVWTPPYMLPTDDDQTISVNLAVRDTNKKLLGVLSTNLFIAHFDSYLSALANKEGGQIYIVDQSGELIASSLPATYPGEKKQIQLQNYILEQINIPAQTTANRLSITFEDQVHHIYTCSLLAEKKLGWYTIIEFPENSFIPELRNSGQYALISSGLILVLTALIGLFASQRITVPIKTLENTARTIAKGIWQHNNIDQTGIKEIDSLADSFQNMSTTLEQIVIEFQEEINMRRQTEEELKSSEAALRVSNEVHEKLTKAAKDAIIQMNSKGEVVFWNQAATAIFGYSKEEILNKKVHALLAQPKDMMRFHDAFPEYLAMGTGPAVGHTIELKAVHKNGHLIPVELSLSTFVDNSERQALAIIRDISERKTAESHRLDLEEQLRQKYKIEAVGLLAGGIAHNFNNNLAIILGNVEMAKHEGISPEDSAILLDHAYTAARRSSDLVKQIMAYTRAEKFQAGPVQLTMIIKETLTLLYSTLPSSVNLQSEFCQNAQKLFIDADLTGVQEMLINLCNNAIHAMDENGNLTVSLQKAELQEADIPAQFSCPPGSYAQISVQDTGIGMSKELMAKIFDPFFTTKDVDQGTGMGLATVMGTVKNYGGMIKVASTVGSGSCFHLYFPLVDLGLNQNTTDNIKIYKGSGKILLIDDDPLLAETSRKMLDKLGYQVRIETSSTNALEHLKRAPFTYDVIITDQTMPEMTGIDFAHKVEELNPALPIILCTGYSNKVSQENYQYHNVKAFCMKPLTMADISQAVNDILKG